MRLSRLALVALMIASPLQVALAADWQLVLSDRNRRVEIDRGSILTSDRGTKVSWGRVVLANNEVAAAGYATIKALNRYDCQNRTFSTIKRVYLDADENLVREETVEDQTPLRVTPNSVDERMWREVCGPPSVADLQKVADEVQKLADTMQPKLEPAPAAPKASAPAPAKTEPPSKPAAAQ
ncbi:surface-adhesin E family protein, partial [Thauera sp.]|uniref:surface-adhesin E family protein n=1 Tax=Thauera sp. TaxID=1905334 RepID=UPI00338E7D6A